MGQEGEWCLILQKVSNKLFQKQSEQVRGFTLTSVNFPRINYLFIFSFAWVFVCSQVRSHPHGLLHLLAMHFWKGAEKCCLACFVSDSLAGLCWVGQWHIHISLSNYHHQWSLHDWDKGERPLQKESIMSRHEIFCPFQKKSKEKGEAGAKTWMNHLSWFDSWVGVYMPRWALKTNERPTCPSMPPYHHLAQWGKVAQIPWLEWMRWEEFKAEWKVESCLRRAGLPEFTVQQIKGQHRHTCWTAECHWIKKNYVFVVIHVFLFLVLFSVSSGFFSCCASVGFNLQMVDGEAPLQKYSNYWIYTRVE